MSAAGRGDGPCIAAAPCQAGARFDYAEFAEPFKQQFGYAL